jgi:hypothetical protein
VTQIKKALPLGKALRLKPINIYDNLAETAKSRDKDTGNCHSYLNFERKTKVISKNRNFQKNFS